jgi:transcriptional regulator with XRE-family HTH domain
MLFPHICRLVDTIRTKRHKLLVSSLVDERRRAGLRQVDLAKQLKQSQSWIARLESGDRRIDVIEFLELAKAIGFDPVRLVRLLLSVNGK